MYIDSLTIAALVVIAVALGLFIGVCFVHNCGSGFRDYRDADTGQRHYKQ